MVRAREARKHAGEACGEPASAFPPPPVQLGPSFKGILVKGAHRRRERPADCGEKPTEDRETSLSGGTYVDRRPEETGGEKP